MYETDNETKLRNMQRIREDEINRINMEIETIKSKTKRSINLLETKKAMRMDEIRNIDKEIYTMKFFDKDKNDDILTTMENKRLAIDKLQRELEVLENKHKNTNAENTNAENTTVENDVICSDSESNNGSDLTSEMLDQAKEFLDGAKKSDILEMFLGANEEDILNALKKVKIADLIKAFKGENFKF